MVEDGELMNASDRMWRAESLRRLGKYRALFKPEESEAVAKFIELATNTEMMDDAKTNEGVRKYGEDQTRKTAD